MREACELQFQIGQTEYDQRFGDPESLKSMGTFPQNPKVAPAMPARPRYGRMDIGLDKVSEGIARATDWLLGQQHPEATGAANWRPTSCWRPTTSSCT